METLPLILTCACAGLALLALWLWREGWRLRAERDLALERARALEADEQRLREAVESIAGKVLQSNSEQFLQLAGQKFATDKGTAVRELEQRRAAVDELVKPIGEALRKTQEELQKLEKERLSAYAGLATQVQGMAKASDDLRKEAGNLSQALRSPNVRGRYGEIQVQRVVELAGMRSYCDFSTQESVSASDGKRHRPDVVVRLPSARVLAIDAKTSLEGYLAALQAPTEEARDAAMARYAAHVVEQVKGLASKNYWSDFAESPELVVMFVPGDQFIDAALQQRPELIELAAQHNVVLASPSTLIGLLRAVHVGWREKNVSDNAQELLKLGRELHERASTAFEHAAALGISIERSVEAYNRFAGSIDSRVMPTLRKFEEHEARSAKKLADLQQIESQPRVLEAASELASRATAAAPLEALASEAPAALPAASSEKRA